MPLAASLLAAEGRPQRYSGCADQSAIDWPIKAEPTSLPSRSTRLPLAWVGNSTCAPSVTIPGYRKQHSTSNTDVMARQGRSWVMTASGEIEHVDDEVDEFDGDERQQHAAAAVHQQVAAQDALDAH